jgi:hypothetical protein
MISLLMDRYSPDEKWSRTYFVSLLEVSDLFNIMSDYSNGVWSREMMQLKLLDDTDSDDGIHDLIMR